MTDTTQEQLNAVLDAAVASGWEGSSPHTRSVVLNALADGLEEHRADLVALASAESHLPPARLDGELSRTAYQLRFLGELAREGACFDAVIEPADPGHPLGPRPDLRRVSEPLGPALVFAASNFPFAFSVLGGDSASALAAGCPVIVKAHPGHPRLSDRVGELARAAGAPLWVVHGVEAGASAVVDARVRVAAFTGSTAGGRALFDLATRRVDPIPFYGELGSVNPVFVSPGAVAARGPEIAAGFVASFTLGVGQFCTKPGLLMLPAGHGLDDALTAATHAVPAAPMLGAWVQTRYEQQLLAHRAHPEVHELVAGTGTSPSLLGTTVAAVRSDNRLTEECFGPASMVVEYDELHDVVGFATSLDGALTATVHAEDAEHEWAKPLLEALRRKVGRIVWNGWPTGVAVSSAMHHGGPWPATTTPTHGSVGGNSIRRFLRPVCFQGVPEPLLPEALRDAKPQSLSRDVDGAAR